MAGLHQSYKDYGFEVVAVSSDVQGAEVVQPFVIRLHLSFTTLLDATGQVTRLYGVTSLPTTYLLDREGRLVTVAIGGYDWATADARAHAALRTQLHALLAALLRNCRTACPRGCRASLLHAR